MSAPQLTDCPVCGCRVEVPDPAALLVECGCCGTVWVTAPDHVHLDRVLVGPEG
ncbi:MAG: hypothetical protein ACE14W_10840 [Candidatus Velamenicoccus archaeovorus]